MEYHIEQVKAMIKKARDYIVFGYPTLTILGFLNAYVYYLSFNIPIQDFLEISEIVTFFLDEVIIGAIVAGLAAVLLTFLNIKRDFVPENYDSEEDEPDQNGKETTRWNKILNRARWVILLLPFTAFVVYFCIIRSIKLWDTPYYIETFISVLVIAIVWILSLIYDLNTYAKTKANTHAINIFLVSFGVFLCLISFLKIRSVKFNNGTIGTQVKYFENNSYVDFKSDSVCYYVGKTTGYLFIFNSTSATTKIIPIENVDQIVLETRSIFPFYYYEEDTSNSIAKDIFGK